MMTNKVHKPAFDALIPAEWEAQAALWTAWPSHPELWEDNLEPARGQIAKMIRAIADTQKVHVMAMGRAAVESAKSALGGDVQIHDAPFGDIWLRDTGPIFAADGRALRFQHNGWGGKYELDYDDTIGDEIAQAAGYAIARHDYVLEGGALEHNGAGALLTTRQCVLNKNRNGWDQDQAEELLQPVFDVKDFVWLDDGLMNDHTDGHIDNLARFIGQNEIVCPAGVGADDPNAALYEKTQKILRDRGFVVHAIPSPGLFRDEDGKIVPASHMNFIIANEVVVVPTYGTQSADEAVQRLADLFPGRKVIGAASEAVLTGGGSFHCITQQEPLKSLEAKDAR